MNKLLKDLVKKHFNLIDGPIEVEEDKLFGEIKTADGELTLTYEGDITVGTEIFVITVDGNVPAPDGEHELEGGIKIETEGGVITSIERGEEEQPEIADETTAGMYPKEKMAEEEIVETIVENTIEEIIEDAQEDIVAAIAEVIAPMIDEMKKDIEEMKSKFAATEKKVETFGLQPAAERTKAEIKNRNTAKNNVDYNPLNEDKRLQFERLLKRNKK
jgi:hypothetical protein